MCVIIIQYYYCRDSPQQTIGYDEAGTHVETNIPLLSMQMSITFLSFILCIKLFLCVFFFNIGILYSEFKLVPGSGKMNVDPSSAVRQNGIHRAAPSHSGQIKHSQVTKDSRTMFIRD